MFKMTKQLCWFLLPIFLSVIFFIKKQTVLELCELETCPCCYGEDLCEDIQENKITLQYASVFDFINNFLSVKNVFLAVYSNKKVVLKKLAHDSELQKLDSNSCETMEDTLVGNSDKLQSFSVCDEKTSNFFWQLSEFDSAQHLSTILQINAEPVLLKIFSVDEYFPVPKLFGFCGRLAVMENCGKPLNNIENYPWVERSYVAYQLLQAAKNFTENHKYFRLYLTDISPDNIVVNDELKVTFVDLEHAVLKMKEDNNLDISDMHHTEHVADLYYYSQPSLCDHSLSDHNIYGVCMMLLSKLSPWPMMQDGLLHDPPEFVTRHHGKLFDYIEMCVKSDERMNRFEISDRILTELRVFWSGHSHL